MGYLLKEALKTLCGVNQWSYAVFWKIGCQNPKLLIWEECYYGPITYSGLQHVSPIENPDFVYNEWQAGRVSMEAFTSLLKGQSGDRVQLLVNKMMMDNHVTVVGEGLVGRAAFTGNHHWILCQSYTKEAHPPEVSNEMHQQISAGMQTVAVIPVLPHGVVQLGSSSAILENMGFVNDVKTLILHLGCVPGALFSDNYATKEPSPKIGASADLEKSTAMDSSGNSAITDLAYITGIDNHQNNSPASRVIGQTSNFPTRQVQDNLKSTGPSFQNLQNSVKLTDHGLLVPNMKSKIGIRSEIESGMTGAEIITSYSELWQESSLYIPESRMNQPSLGPSGTNSGDLSFLEQHMLVDGVAGDHVTDSQNKSNGFLSQWRTNGGYVASSHNSSSSVPSHEQSALYNALGNLLDITNPSLSTQHGLAKNNMQSVRIAESTFQSVAQCQKEGSMKILPMNDLFFGSSDKKHQFTEKECRRADFEVIKNEVKNNYGFPNSLVKNAHIEDAYVQPQSADDLFDVLGVNLKNKLFEESWNDFLNGGPDTSSQNVDRDNCALHRPQNDISGLKMVNEGHLNSGAFSVTGTDHLLDAVVSRVWAAAKQSSNDLSCRTTKLSSSSAPTASTSPVRANASNQMHEDFFGLSKSITKPAGAFSTCLFNSGLCKEESGVASQSSSFYGSQGSSWVEQGSDIKHFTSPSSEYSKRPDETSKSNRKRLKPGENPRPRPKDRQMIQDRVKELREIVPNGAKCSIDALLERTIKHMLFLQSVTKHADKLKQTGESKIISKEGGLLLKDNFEGGATWAYEVGSQSMVCPIIVEDLSPPRQMLVEMLCEERGLFLEIADIIRGLGLTILKGVMETRNDKIWARFAVEANRDVTRMEIFLSLVRLLEQTVNNGAASANCIGSDDVMAQQPFHQVVPIPATGRPSTFQ